MNRIIAPITFIDVLVFFSSNGQRRTPLISHIKPVTTLVVVNIEMPESKNETVIYQRIMSINAVFILAKGCQNLLFLSFVPLQR